MIGYTCKYTPVELLAALGGQPALLNREANAFSHAEALTHNHFCCHAKAVLEECRRDGVRELVLVNCCDSIRRCYDVLRAQGGVSFGAVFLCVLLLSVCGSAFTLLLGPDLQAILNAFYG